MLFRFFLLILLIHNSKSATNEELKEELILVRKEIGLLKVENKDQSSQIAILKEIVESQNKTIDQKIVKEINQKIKNCGDENLSGIMSQPKQTFRIISSLYAGVNNTKSCRLLATVAYDDKITKSKTPIPESNATSISKFFGMPTSCSDLSQLGYSLNGFYKVKVNNENSMENVNLETVFCAFKQPEGTFNLSAVEKRIAPNLNTRPITNNENAKCAFGTGIHFHVMRWRQREFDNSGPPYENSISFDDILLNMGDGMVMEKNGRRDTFTAPKSGVYQFVFTATMGSIPRNVSSFFRLYRRQIKETKSGLINQSSTKDTGNSITMGAILKLSKGDDIFLLTKQGQGYQILEASFSGSLLEAE